MLIHRYFRAHRRTWAAGALFVQHEANASIEVLARPTRRSLAFWGVAFFALAALAEIAGLLLVV